MWFPALRALSAPNAVTSANLLLGLLAIHLVTSGHLLAGAVLAALAAPLDLVDGWLARRLNQQSALGARLDSLADMVSFGVAPVFAAAHVGVPLPLAGLYTLGAAWRLAWYDEVGLQQRGGRACFHGVPSPMAALFLLAAVVTGRPVLAGAATVLLAAAMLLDVPVRKNGPLYLLAPLLLLAGLAVRFFLPVGG